MSGLQALAERKRMAKRIKSARQRGGCLLSNGGKRGFMRGVPRSACRERFIKDKDRGQTSRSAAGLPFASGVSAFVWAGVQEIDTSFA